MDHINGKNLTSHIPKKIKQVQSKKKCPKLHHDKSVHKLEKIKNEPVIKPLVEKFDTMQGFQSGSGKSSGHKVNMRNLGRKFISLLKTNAIENKTISNEPQDNDLNLLKEQVSVRQIQQVFMKKSNANGHSERKPFIPKTSNKINSHHNVILNEFLESVKKKSSSLRNTKIVESLVPHKMDLSKLEEVAENEALPKETGSTTLDMFPITRTSITVCHMQTIESKDKVEDKESNVNTGDENQLEETSSGVFQPQPYVFQFPAETTLTNCPITAKPPPFWALLDNFIAVVWALLNDGSLGINQLHWTYELLKVLKYKNGTTPDTIEDFIEAVQDKLIFSYADFYEMKEKSKEEQKPEVPPEDKEEKFKRIARRTEKKNKWVDRNALMKSFSLREIVRQGTNSIGKPSEADKLIIQSLIPTATREYHSKSKATQGDQPEEGNNCCLDEKQIEEVKNILTKLRKEQAEKIQQDMSKYQKIETLMVKVDNKFVPTLGYEAAQRVSSNMHKMDENKITNKY